MKRLNNHISNEKILSLNNYIIEKLKIGKSTKHQYNYQPQNKKELKEIIEERLINDKNADLNDIDISKIIDMGDLFSGLDPHNIDISQWDVSNVRNMSAMFHNCRNFNCDLSDWDVSNVEDMNYMFYWCKKFKGKGLENWNINNEHMRWMFYMCNYMKKIPTWYKN